MMGSSKLPFEYSTPLHKDKKIYFASDFHLGAPEKKLSIEREKKIILWLNDISKDADAIFLLGDIFDFWFEYKHTIPKGFTQFQAKIAEINEQKKVVHFFTGNHDMWMFDYFTNHLNVPIIRKPISLVVGNKRLHIGHGDGLGSGDYPYKLLKKLFANPILQWIFHRLHPNFGMGMANIWLKLKRKAHNTANQTINLTNERLLNYCKQVEKNTHHDYYIFGHSHILMQLPVSENATYFNLGTWLRQPTYLEFDGKSARLKTF